MCRDATSHVVWLNDHDLKHLDRLQKMYWQQYFEITTGV